VEDQPLVSEILTDLEALRSSDSRWFGQETHWNKSNRKRPM
jgi:hypothetical protein